MAAARDVSRTLGYIDPEPAMLKVPAKTPELVD
jgi:hypothetical protein